MNMLPLEDLLDEGALTEAEVLAVVDPVGFHEPLRAVERLRRLCSDDACREMLRRSLRMLLATLTETARPDASLVNFERYVQSVPDRGELFEYLANNPRAVEILIKLFVGSQFLTEILLRNPSYLAKLTAHKRLAEFKSRPQFREEGHTAAAGLTDPKARFDAYRRFQHWELLRLGACDAFGLMELKAVTIQLSLLADSLVQNCLEDLGKALKLDIHDFAVLAMGKLGGEELNYSSDIDLIFLCEENSAKYWELGQKLIRALMDSTREGFLYRVDMRLRPWGKSGALVNTVDAHIKYLQQHGMLWEFQALLKARPIAGNTEVAMDFLTRAEPLMYHRPAEELRDNVRSTKTNIENNLKRTGRAWGEVKSGEGSIRDVEFITQYLQLRHGGLTPQVRSIGTLDGLVRLAEFALIQAGEYRQLTSGYLFLRTVEHALQLMHHKQTHTLPDDQRELAYLARRLDYPDTESFLQQYEQHSRAIRRIFEKYILRGDDEPGADRTLTPEEIFRDVPDYRAIFDEEQMRTHERLLGLLDDDRPIVIDAKSLDDPERFAAAKTPPHRYELTIVGYDYPGDLSVITGLLFVYGFNILDGQVFSGEDVRAPSGTGIPGQPRTVAAGHFVDVFTIEPERRTEGLTDDDMKQMWREYESELVTLVGHIKRGEPAEAQGTLVKRVAAMMRHTRPGARTLYGVQIEIDNETSDRHTILNIRTIDTPGFLYEFCNALTMSGMDVNRVIIETAGERVSDVLYVTEQGGGKVLDETRLRQLRSTTVLIKQFTHLLPESPNPEQALLQFREFLEQRLDRDNWYESLSRLGDSSTLVNLATLMGVSSFLWEDFLKIQHDHLFPVLTNEAAIAVPKSREALETELAAELEGTTPEEGKPILNAFKDREMFRIDMRHILGRISEFGQFSQELTELAEVVVQSALELATRSLTERHGIPIRDDGEPCRLSFCALGKCGGSELGFASDIELMFIYDEDGQTNGREPISTTEYYPKLVERFQEMISARRDGIFTLDLRLRPYGNAGSLAVRIDTFEQYFSLSGPAWPYERQALVKLRPIAGDDDFGNDVVKLRDRLIYGEAAFDLSAMRAMRDKQLTQLVKGGTLNAKLSPGGLVDIEYLVQGLQITKGGNNPMLRTTNTLEALVALELLGLVSAADVEGLRDAYIFLRRVIDALRVVRGHAKDLTVPESDSEGFLFLARRLEYDSADELRTDLERHMKHVRASQRLAPAT